MDKGDVDKGMQGEDLRSSPTISSSTESETFETWTLVTPELATDRDKTPVQDAKVTEKIKSINELDHQTHQQQDIDDRHIENIKKDEHHTDGEISDGISIISDSESGGRSSPQPAPRRSSPTKRHSSPKTLTEQTDEELESDNNDEMTKTVTRSSYEPLTPPNTPDMNAALPVTEAIAGDSMMLQQSNERDNESTDSGMGCTLFQVNFNCTYVALFLAAFVAILAIFGRMRTGPMLDTRDLNSVYSKLNEILAKTSHIEAIIQDTMNGLDDRSYDQYSNMLMRMKELNERFEANNLAMQDALYRLTKSQKYPALNPDKKHMQASDADEDNVEFDGDTERSSVPEKLVNSNWPPKEKLRGPRQAPTPQEKQRRPQEQSNKKFKKDQAPKPGERDNKGGPKQNMNYKKREPNQKYDQNSQRNNRKEQFENGRNEAQPKNEHQAHENRHKNNYKEKASNERFKDNKYKRNSREQEDEDWMERRRRSREDARKNPEENIQYPRTDDGNWYLERGNSRQKARKYEKADNRS